MKLTTFGNVRVREVLVKAVAPSPIILFTVEAVADALTVKSIVVLVIVNLVVAEL
jgi:hypothetical protein